ncbi:uncharacterized protein BP5553_09755 [Venustampulla echinocandica]|uniref:Uncharacterized protein n=1 Tax=Venustampulla echinocandica TaxID=2656787 RepID=A0A370TBY2_9HELO|nr:uncharacterized protein BP5553_09755 [Venustampulla echinocandica]RDL31546.1 hypothetical protein BP5553_09755 [Venustampulla echinocandica]
MSPSERIVDTYAGGNARYTPRDNLPTLNTFTHEGRPQSTTATQTRLDTSAGCFDREISLGQTDNSMEAEQNALGEIVPSTYNMSPETEYTDQTESQEAIFLWYRRADGSPSWRICYY